MLEPAYTYSPDDPRHVPGTAEIIPPSSDILEGDEGAVTRFVLSLTVGDLAASYGERTDDPVFETWLWVRRHPWYPLSPALVKGALACMDSQRQRSGDTPFFAPSCSVVTSVTPGREGGAA